MIRTLVDSLTKELSFAGKDLLEASNAPKKASYQFKLLLDDLAKDPEWDSKNRGVDDVFSGFTQEIGKFSNFIYSTPEKINYFSQRLCKIVLETCQKHELETKQVVRKK